MRTLADKRLEKSGLCNDPQGIDTGEGSIHLFLCDLPKGHDGDHRAENYDTANTARWKDEAPLGHVRTTLIGIVRRPATMAGVWKTREEIEEIYGVKKESE